MKNFSFYKKLSGLTALKIFSMVLGFYILTLMAKFLTENELGIYTSIIVWSGVLATPFNGALSQYLINQSSTNKDFLTEYLSKEFSVFCKSITIYLGAFLLVGLTIGIDLVLLVMTSLMIISLFVNAFLSTYLLVKGRPFESQLGVSVFRPLLFLIFIYLGSTYSELDANILLMYGFISYMLASFLTIIIYKNHINLSVSKFKGAHRGTYFSYLGNVSLASFYAQAPILILSIYSMEKVSSYFIAYKVVGLISVFGSIVGVASSKIYADNAALSERNEARTFFKYLMPMNLVIAIVIAFGWFLFGDALINMFFGEVYADTVYSLVAYLIPSQLLFLIFNPLFTYMYGVQKKKSLFLLQLVSNCILILVIFLLYPDYGVFSVAWGVTASSVFLYLGLGAMFFKLTKD